MHQTNAMLTHIFSCLPAGRHQVPAGATMAECASVWLMSSPFAVTSRQRRLGQTEDLVQSPERVEAEHHDQTGHQEEKRVIQEPLAQRRSLIARVRGGHRASSLCEGGTALWNLVTPDRRKADMTWVIRASRLPPGSDTCRRSPRRPRGGCTAALPGAWPCRSDP